MAILIAYFFVQDMTGVDLADEDARFMEYLERNGWEGVVVGDVGLIGQPEEKFTRSRSG